MQKVGFTFCYFDGDGDGLYLIFGDFHLYHAGFGVDGVLLVKDKITNTVVDIASFVMLDGLEGVGVMTDKGIGTCLHESMGF